MGKKKRSTQGLPRLSCDFKDDEVTAVKNGDNDHKHQEQEADEKHEGLDGHSCRDGTESRPRLLRRSEDTNTNQNVLFCFFLILKTCYVKSEFCYYVHFS